MIKKTLWVSGIVAAIAVLIPGSVGLGLFLGVLPGLILAVAPTICSPIARSGCARRR